MYSVAEESTLQGWSRRYEIEARPRGLAHRRSKQRSYSSSREQRRGHQEDLRGAATARASGRPSTAPKTETGENEVPWQQGRHLATPGPVARCRAREEAKKWRCGGLLVLDGGNGQEKEEGSSGQRWPWASAARARSWRGYAVEEARSGRGAGALWALEATPVLGR